MVGLIPALILALGFAAGWWLRGAVLLRRIPRASGAKPETPLETSKVWDCSRTAPPEAPKDYVTTSIPRGPRSWRMKRRELEREHNTQQKERDALISSPARPTTNQGAN